MYRRLLVASSISIAMLATGCGTSGVDDSTSGADASAGDTEPSSVADEQGVTDTDSGAAIETDSTEGVVAPDIDDHDDPADHEWSASDATTITLDGSEGSIDGDGASVDGGIVTIASAGTYLVQGSLTDGQLLVASADDGIVRLVLDGVDITNTTGSPLVVEDASEVVVILEEGTANTLTDATDYVFPDDETDEPNAALFSRADLTITGGGSLVVTGNYNDGIASKDGLVVDDGLIEVTAVDDGIRGKDYLVIEGGEITVDSGGDGLKSDNEDTSLGAISISEGTLTIDAGGDGMAANHVTIDGGTLDVVAGGGHTAALDADASAKGVKGTVSVTIDGGTLTVDAADDAVHSNDTITISGGSLTLTTADDAVHADNNVGVHGGTITVTDSYEGIESAVITIVDGVIDITSSDDGLNVAGGNDSSGLEPRGRGGPGGQADQFAASGDYLLSVSGGSVTIDAGGDGFDSNGNAEITGGTVIVYGPTAQNNGAIDVNGSFAISGGTLLAGGSAGMAETPDATSSQAIVAFRLNGSVAAGSTIQILDSGGTEIVSYRSTKPVEAFVASTPDLISGETYEIVVDGESLGTLTA